MKQQKIIPKQKHIRAVGIEFEGAWSKYKSAETGLPAHPEGNEKAVIKRLKQPLNLKYDGSVSIPDNRATWKGEIASKPLQIRHIESWINKAVPDLANSTCGIHVHISVKHINNYIKLATPKYYNYYIKKMGKWGNKMGLPKNHLFWERLNGKNTYCKAEFKAEDQMHVEGRGGDRYTHINYCYGLWNTMEFRLLPAFHTNPENKPNWKNFTSPPDINLIKSAIFETLRTIESYLENETEQLQNTWEEETEVQMTNSKQEVYEEIITPEQAIQYKGESHAKLYDRMGWVSPHGLKLTGKNIPLEKYVCHPEQTYLIPENIKPATEIHTVSRRVLEERHNSEYSHQIYEEE